MGMPPAAGLTISKTSTSVSCGPPPRPLFAACGLLRRPPTVLSPSHPQLLLAGNWRLAWPFAPQLRSAPAPTTSRPPQSYPSHALAPRRSVTAAALPLRLATEPQSLLCQNHHLQQHHHHHHIARLPPTYLTFVVHRHHPPNSQQFAICPAATAAPLHLHLGLTPRYLARLWH